MEDESIPRYTYTIFDGNPTEGCVDITAEGEVEAYSRDEALELVQLELEVVAAGLRPEDGYGVGQVLYADVHEPDGTIVATPTHTLTEEDLGITPPVMCECGCECGREAAGKDDSGTPVCDECSDYYEYAGDMVCSRVQDDTTCRHCGQKIQWGVVQTCQASPNWVDGKCGCADKLWTQVDMGGKWGLCETDQEKEA